MYALQPNIGCPSANRNFLMLRSPFLLLIAVVVTLVGCGRLSQREAGFLKDRKVVIETVRHSFEQPYGGLSRWMPKDVPSNLDFLDPDEHHIRMSMHSSAGWYGDDQWEVIYRPAVGAGNQTELPIDPEKLLDFYFGQLETSGFTSGTRGCFLAKLNSMQAASKSWANKDRTLLLTAYVVSDKQSGETIITTIVRETFN